MNPNEHINELLEAMTQLEIGSAVISDAEGRLTLSLTSTIPQRNCGSEKESITRAMGVGIFQSLRHDSGVRVMKGEIIGLLTVGNICRPVTALCDGVLSQILQPAGVLVDYGTPLFAIHPAA